MIPTARTLDHLPYYAACIFDDDWAPMLRDRGEDWVRDHMAEISRRLFHELPGLDIRVADIRAALLALFESDGADGGGK